MKYLFIDTYYPGFLKHFRQKYPLASGQSYNKQKQLLIAQCFGTSDFYSFNLRKLGFQTHDLIVNDEILERQWALENNLAVHKSGWISVLQSLPYIHKFIGRPGWIQEIVLAQIKKYEPEVIFVQDLSILNPEILQKAKNYARLLIGQIASPLPNIRNIRMFDLILTSFPHFVDRFKRMDVRSEYFKLAFESRILSYIGKRKKHYDVTFIGSFSPYHTDRIKLMESVASQVPLNIWGQGTQYLLPNSKIKKNYHGEAWGLDMYRIMAESKIVINHHINTAGDFANNMRLFEATGMGALLITDNKKNIKDLFRVGEEIDVYNGSVELVKKINYYLSHDTERETMAQAGQKKTLNDHNYLKRMEMLTAIVRKYLD